MQGSVEGESRGNLQGRDASGVESGTEVQEPVREVDRQGPGREDIGREGKDWKRGHGPG